MHSDVFSVLFAELVAVKAIDLGTFDDETRQLITAEAQILTSLHHPAIIELFQVP